MRSKRKFFVLSTSTVLTAALFAIAACGGGSKEGGDPKTPGTDPAASSGSSTGASSSGAAGSSGGGTTTTSLGDGGDLQGAKLSEKSHSEMETKGDGGPKAPPGGSANEPGRGAKDIQTIVAGKRDEARACYDKALAGHPGIEGDLDIKWVIDPQGNVTDAQVDSTKSQILEPSVGTCIIDVIKKIKFNPSAKGYETRAHYPFNFHPKGPTAAKDAGK
jgi:outer membrane biosynthesis protein TonB